MADSVESRFEKMPNIFTPDLHYFLKNVEVWAFNNDIEIDFSFKESNVGLEQSQDEIVDEILLKSNSLCRDGLFDLSFHLLQISLDAGFQSAWILYNQARSLLQKGDIEGARKILNELIPASDDLLLLNAKNQLDAETQELSTLFKDYAQPHLLRDAYFKFKDVSAWKSIKVSKGTMYKSLELAVEMRESYRIDDSFSLLLILAKDIGYNPWIEDNIAKTYTVLEDWTVAMRHWSNIIEKSSNINVIEAAKNHAQRLEKGCKLERQEEIEKFGHLLFEEYCLRNNIENKDNTHSEELSRRFWLYDFTVDKFLTDEINRNLWADFRCNDLRYAARYLLRNKIYHGRCFLKSIWHDGGISLDKIMNRCRPFFDNEFYFHEYKDLDLNLINGLEHYCIYGWKEGRNPSSTFSTTQYLEQNLSIRELQINPLYFYVCNLEGEKNKGKNHIHSEQIFEFISKVGAGSFMHAAKPLSKLPTEIELKFPMGRFFNPSKLWYNCSKNNVYKSLKIHFIIPDFAKGGGGHMAIFRMIRHLEEKGHIITVWVLNPDRKQHSADLRDDVIKYFQPVSAKILPLDASYYFASGDCVIATGWQTVEYVKSSCAFREKFYFVQDYEPYFYARGTYAILAEQTYNEDFACICSSPWLSKYLSERFGRWTRHLMYAYDHTIYKTSKEQIIQKYSQIDPSESILHIAVYARCHTERRCVELALEALNKLSKINNRFMAHFFGDDNFNIDIPYPAINYGILSHEQLNILYSKCTIGMSFSATNYSIIPQEMMAAGLPVFDIRVDSTIVIYPKGVINLMQPNSDLIAQVLDNCLKDLSLLVDQAKNALDWVQTFSWERAGNDFEQALVDKLKMSTMKNMKNSYEIKKIVAPDLVCINDNKFLYKASIVIPTYNAGSIISEVLDSIIGQCTGWKFQCIIIDSGSNDETIKLCMDKCAIFPDLSIYQIPKKDFQHGFTRNIGVDISDSEFVAFITQDAIPANNKWLYNLVSALEANTNAAGAFGRHIAHDNASPFIAKELQDHFRGFQELPVSLSIATDQQRVQNNDQDWRKILHFYSDNNSCLRKVIWQQLPLPCVPFGEDQMWAELIIRNGFQKVYAHDAIVKHSHDYSPAETFERASTEAEFFSSCFGYEFHSDLQLAYIGISRDIFSAFSLARTLKCTTRQKKSRCANIYAKHLGLLNGTNATR